LLGIIINSHEVVDMMAAETFHPFERLPRELQLRVWHYAISAVPSRVVNIRTGPCPFVYINRPSTGFRRIRRKESDQYTSPSSIPSVLHTCHTSRQLASQRWQLAFPRPNSSPKVYFDFTGDILWYGDQSWDLGYFFQDASVTDKHALWKVKRFAFHIHDALEGCRAEDRFTGAWRAGGGRVARSIHTFMPFLDEIVLLGRYAGDLEHDFMNSRKSCVRLTHPTDTQLQVFRQQYGQDLEKFETLYEKMGWNCPQLKWMEWLMVERSTMSLLGEKGDSEF
jgi:2EXR family